MGGRLVAQGHACRLGALPGVQGIFRCSLGATQPGDAHGQTQAVQLRRGFQAIAPVVARATRDPDAAGMGRQRQRQPRRGRARPLHQGIGRELGCRRLLDAPGGSNIKQCRALAGRDGLHVELPRHSNVLLMVKLASKALVASASSY